MKKAHSVSWNRRSSPPKTRAQNLKRESTSGKNGGKSVPSRRFSKSNSPANRPLVETDLKNLAAVRSAQIPEGVSRPTIPSGLTRDMARSTNNEYRLMSPPLEQGVMAGRAQQPAELVGPLLSRVELARKRVSLLVKQVDSGASRCGSRGVRYVRGPHGEPLDFLQLDAVPRRVADYRVETALRMDVLPSLPDPGESGLPVQKRFAVGDGPGVTPYICWNDSPTGLPCQCSTVDSLPSPAPLESGGCTRSSG